MVRRTLVGTFIFAFIILPAAGTGYASEISLNAGLAEAIGEGTGHLNIGLSLGGNAFFKVSPSILLGGRMAYNIWTIEGNDEYVSVTEFIPSVRILSKKTRSKRINLFAQLGLGYFVWDSSYGYSDSEYGLDMGLGLTIGRKRSNVSLEILTLFNIIFTEDESFKYLSLIVGPSFKI
jgi:hypothetical protein